MFRGFGVLVFWCFGVLVFRCFGVLVFWGRREKTPKREEKKENCSAKICHPRGGAVRRGKTNEEEKEEMKEEQKEDEEQDENEENGEEEGKDKEEHEKKTGKEQTSVRFCQFRFGQFLDVELKTVWVGLRVCEGVTGETRFTPAFRFQQTFMWNIAAFHGFKARTRSLNKNVILSFSA